MTTPTTEEYLEVIYMMQAENKTVKGARLAEAMRVSRPTVTATLRRLSRDGLVSVNEKKEVHLTKKGFRLADQLQRRHRIIERWLTDVLGFDWAQSDAEAHRLEHVFSDEIVDKLNEMLGRPGTCPHGNPIPGNQSANQADTAFPLSRGKVGDWVQVERISEYAENTAQLLEYLGSHKIRPGAKIRIEDHSPMSKALTLLVSGRHMSLGTDIAEFVWVTRSK